MSTLDNASKIGRPNQNLVLETAGRIWVKVQDRFYELDFRDRDKGVSRVTNVVNNNITETTEEPDMSQYVTKNYLKSTLTEYVTKRAWADVKETTTMLENSMLEGFTESISPITVNTMQVVVGTDQLQYDFIENYNDDTVKSGGFISEGEEAILTQYHVKLTGGWIKHYTIEGPTTVRAVVDDPNNPEYNKDVTLAQYCRWHIADEEFDLSDSAYYVYIKVPKLNVKDIEITKNANGTYTIPGNTSASLEEALKYKTNQRIDNEFGDAHYVVSTSAIEMETDEDTNNYYLLFAIINSPSDDGLRSYVTMNGFTEITPGRVTAYRFMSPDGIQYLNFLDKAFHLGDNNSYLHFDADTGELRLKGTIVQSPSGAEFPVPCYRGEFDPNAIYYYGDSVSYNGEVWLNTFSREPIGKGTNYYPNDTIRPQESIVVNGQVIYPWTLYSSKAKSNFLSTVFARTATQPTTPTGGNYNSPIPTDIDTYGNLIWSDWIPAEVADTSLWMSQRLFTEDGNYPQDSEWTTPVAAMDGADIDFEWCADDVADPGNPDNHPSGVIWSNHCDEYTIWMAVRKKSNGVWSNWQVSKIKGEKGDKGDSPITADLTDEMTGIMVGEDCVLQGDSSPIDFTAHLYYGNDAQTITKIRFSNPNNKIEVGVPGSGNNVITTNPNTSINNNSPTIRIKVKDGWTASTVKIGIELYCVRNGVEVSASCTHTIVGVKEGQDGHLFKLLANTTEIIFNDPDDTSTQNVACNAIVISPKGDVSTTTLSGSKFYYTVYGTPSISRREYTLNTNVPVSVNNTKVEFEWEIPYNNSTIVIDRESVPILKNGKSGTNGYSSATLYLYGRFPGVVTGPNVDLVYNFTTGLFNDPGDENRGNIDVWGINFNTEKKWYPVVPNGVDPCYITSVYVTSRENQITIYNVSSEQQPKWSIPKRLTYNGLNGKLIRGIRKYEQGYNHYDGYEDHDINPNTGEDNLQFYDVVYAVVGNERRYYYCRKGYGASSSATPDTDHWVQANQFEFVSTNVLLAQDAHIDILSGNSIYLRENASSNDVSCGIQGGGNSTDVNFFAGNSTPENAPFKVTHNGNLYASQATITGDITATSLTLGQGATIPTSGVNGLDNTITNINNNVSAAQTAANNAQSTANSAASSANTANNRITTSCVLKDVVISSGDTNFVVSSDGLLTANNAVITGSIYAGDATFAGWQRTLYQKISDVCTRSYSNPGYVYNIPTVGEKPQYSNLICSSRDSAFLEYNVKLNLPSPSATLNGFTFKFLVVPPITKSDTVDGLILSTTSERIIDYSRSGNKVRESYSDIKISNGIAEVVCINDPNANMYFWVITYCSGAIRYIDSYSTSSRRIYYVQDYTFNLNTAIGNTAGTDPNTLYFITNSSNS